MIISVSRRTDIPAFLGEWFLGRLEERFVDTVNPMNPKQISHISLAPDDVDCFVFWTKNPQNFFPAIKRVNKEGYRYYFNFTLNPYGKDLEPNLPEKQKLIETFAELSRMTGKEKIIWRYDPIIINAKHTINYHEDSFAALCEQLHNFTNMCVISFVDCYSYLREKFLAADICESTSEEISAIAGKFSIVAKRHSITLAACAEKTNLTQYGILPSRCIDADLINQLFGLSLRHKKDPSQRKFCGCSASRDIGTYNTCQHGCVYCYAAKNFSQRHKGAEDEAKTLFCLEF